MFCHKCGVELPKDAYFCLKCGVKTRKGIEAGVSTSWVEVRDEFSRFGEEIEKAFSKAGKEIEKAFKTARKGFRESVSEVAIVCSNCGEKNRSEAKFCFRCGKKLD